jgi:hypothetical protein
MTTRPGRRALFESAETDGLLDVAPMDEQKPLFSAPPRRSGTVVVECSQCEARTPMPASDVTVPVSLSLLSPVWMFATYPHRLHCPACDRHTWCRLG